MHLPKTRLVPLLIITLILGTISYSIGDFGLDKALHKITTARCKSGAFLTHSDKVGGVAADADNASGPDLKNKVQNGSVYNSSTTQASGTNIIPNNDLESVSGTPTGWLTNIFGKNKATFSVVPGRTSSTAVQTQITEHTDGDADWYYPEIQVKPGQYYTYRDYYHSTVSTRAIIMFRHNTGKIEYINLRIAPAAKDWTKYSVNFFVPGDVESLQVYHPIAAVGILTTDDYSLEPAQPIGFDQPLVSLTFDDGWKSIHDNALPLLNRFGLASTQYVISGYIGQATSYMSPQDIYDFQDSGHEIASHTVNHADLTLTSNDKTKLELDQSKKELGKCFGIPNDFAAPYGTYNPASLKATASIYDTARSTDVGFNTADNISRYQLVVQNVAADTPENQIKDWLNTAKNNNAWLILVYHQIEKSPSPYSRGTQDFTTDLQAIKDSGITVKTVQQAYSEIRLQVKNQNDK